VTREIAGIRALALAVAVWALAAPSAQAVPVGSTTLTVNRTGVQLGTITDNLGQINCGTDCSGTYQRDCLQGTPANCTEPGEPKHPALTTTVPSGFQVIWSETCDQGSNTANPCSVEATGTVTAHYDDISPPTVSLSGPGAGPARGTVTLSATAGDTQSGVSSVQFLVGGVPVGTDSSAPYSISYDTSTRADGPVNVVARATNGDSDVSDSSAVGITIDNTLPNLTVGGPDGATFGPGSTQTWTYTASDTTTGPPGVQCSVTPTGASPVFAACSPGSGSHSVTNRPEGSYTARFRATDGAGNAREEVRTFSIDATPAVTQIDSGPADGSSSTATSATFTFSADEPGSTFECRVYPAALTPGAFGPCTGSGTHTASGFAPGTYAFEVRATDPHGNVDASPAKRTFTVTASSTGGNTGGTGGNTGGTGGNTGGTGGNTGGGGVVAGQRIDALVRTFWFRFGKRTKVRTLTVVGAPQGANVKVTCKGKGCAFRRKALTFKGSQLVLAKLFKKRKLGPGSTIVIVVSKAGLVSKTFRYKTRRTKFPSAVIT
jgi:hypothetical protein